MQDLNDNPNSNSIKTDIKITGENLIGRGQTLNNIFNQHKSDLQDQKDMLVDEANSYLSQLDELTQSIREVEAGNGPNMYEQKYANELRDKRDLLEVKLSKLGNFKAYKDTASQTNENNISDYGLAYNYEFKLDDGRINGIDKSIESINNLQNGFNKTFESIAQKVSEFINSDMENPNDMLQWKYDNKPSKDVDNVFVGFSAEIDGIVNVASTTNAILQSHQNKHDQLSKVNVDEELTKMITYQRAYEAAAKIIQTQDEMLKTVINMKA